MKKMVLTLLSCAIGLSLFAQSLSQATTEKLCRMPLRCINQEFPNKTGHAAESEHDATLLPRELHPSFYGCLDWHSSVHGHWLLVTALKEFPQLANRDSILSVLENSFQPDKISEEVAYFTRYRMASTFERTYGWAWLLKLDQELRQWNEPRAQRWQKTLSPLTEKIVTLWKNYLPKQTYPNRTGVHPNTAFGLVFALDWARVAKDTVFEKAICERAKNFYLSNTQTPAHLEPDGTDFLSPSLEIADLMRRVLTKEKFGRWLTAFYTPAGIKRITALPVVSDRTDFQIVHLDGLALSRAWCMKGIARSLPNEHPWKKLFANKGNEFLVRALPNVTSGNYGGDHWLASFAFYALTHSL